MRFKYVTVFCILVFAVSILGTALKIGPDRGWILFGIGAIALITFFAFFWGDPPYKSETVRNAIACSMIVTYLLLVITLVFFRIIGEVTEITQVLLTNFTTTIGIVIASYFGATAFIDAKKDIK